MKLFYILEFTMIGRNDVWKTVQYYFNNRKQAEQALNEITKLCIANKNFNNPKINCTTFDSMDDIKFFIERFGDYKLGIV